MSPLRLPVSPPARRYCSGSTRKRLGRIRSPGPSSATAPVHHHHSKPVRCAARPSSRTSEPGRSRSISEFVRARGASTRFPLSTIPEMAVKLNISVATIARHDSSDAATPNGAVPVDHSAQERDEHGFRDRESAYGLRFRRSQAYLGQLGPVRAIGDANPVGDLASPVGMRSDQIGDRAAPSEHREELTIFRDQDDRSPRPDQTTVSRDQAREIPPLR